MKKVWILLVCIGTSVSYAQQVDGVYVNTEILPSFDVSTAIKLEAGIDLPVINTSKDKLTIGGKVQNTSFNYVDEDVPFETDEIENFNAFSFRFNYQRSLSDSWALNVMGESQVSSNFGENEIKTDDLFFNALVTLEKYNAEKNSIWTFGAAYDIKYGLYYPIPVISYTKRIDDAWAYKIGVPDTRVKWSFAKNHEVEGFATLNGFTGNVNDGVDVYKVEYSGTLRQTSVLLGLGYNFNFLKNFKATLNGGYSVYNSLQLQDYDNEEIYDFEIPNSFYLNVGVKYIFKSKTNVKRLY
ncbi:DUF6268 family outer membrane beta-barrel protein [Formosa algae]|uniref:DUF6268 family outer membrane beta-barrel protein n=1 Tax=Formosa algae TaxID=225843 RepID=UPI000CCE48BF|nr:DUF6268 family outer membrane beta-barrel protein [Formosa algae]PNW26552.1 hypothetical protein BKP44_16625 [Formosa algae]